MIFIIAPTGRSHKTINPPTLNFPADHLFLYSEKPIAYESYCTSVVHIDLNMFCRGWTKFLKASLSNNRSVFICDITNCDFKNFKIKDKFHNRISLDKNKKWIRLSSTSLKHLRRLSVTNVTCWNRIYDMITVLVRSGNH